MFLELKETSFLQNTTEKVLHHLLPHHAFLQSQIRFSYLSKFVSKVLIFSTSSCLSAFGKFSRCLSIVTHIVRSLFARSFLLTSLRAGSSHYVSINFNFVHYIAQPFNIKNTRSILLHNPIYCAIVLYVYGQLGKKLRSRAAGKKVTF